MFCALATSMRGQFRISPQWSKILPPLVLFQLVAVLFGPVGFAIAQDSNPTSIQECANALAGIEQEALACEARHKKEWEQLLELTYDLDAQRFCGGETRPDKDVSLGDYFDNLRACMEMYKEATARPDSPSWDVIQVASATGWDPFELRCDVVFAEKEKALAASCSKYPTYGGLDCSGRKMLNAAAASFTYSTLPSDRYAPPNSCNPRAKQPVKRPPPSNPSAGASINLAALGCGSVPGATKACLDGCAAPSDPKKTPEQLKQCTDGCRANEKMQIDLCLGPLTGGDQKDGTSRTSRSPDTTQTRPGNAKLREPTASTTSASAGVPPAKKNNLDRFDLGPTFVNPDSSSSVSRTARGTSSPKMQAKTVGTSDAAKTPKTSGAPMAAGGGIQGTVKTPGVSDAAKPSMSQKTLSAPIVGGTKDTVKEQVGGAGGTVRVEPK